MTSTPSACALFLFCSVLALLVDKNPAAATGPLFFEGNRDALLLHYPPPIAAAQAVIALWMASTVNLILALTVPRLARGTWIDRLRRGGLGEVVTALACVLFVNWAVADLDRASAPRFLPDAELQWRPVGGAELDGVRLNSLGLRAADPAPHRAGVSRVLVMGDSATWGAQWRPGGAPPTPYPQQLERIAGARGVDLEVINAAVVGYSSLQGRRLLPLLLDAYHPDFLMLGYNNDSMPSGGVPDRERTADRGWVRACQRWLYRSDLYLLLRQRLMPRISASSSAGGQWVPRISLDEHVENYRAMLEQARSRGIKACLLILPSTHGPGYDEADVALGREMDIPVIDLHALFKRTGRPAAELLPDLLHPTEETHAILAQMIFEAVFQR